MAIDKSTDLVINIGGFTVTLNHHSINLYTDINYDGIIKEHKTNTAYKAGDLIRDVGSYDGYVFRASSDFTTGTDKPTFDKTVDKKTQDNGTDWICEINPSKCIVEYNSFADSQGREDCVFRCSNNPVTARLELSGLNYPLDIATLELSGNNPRKLIWIKTKLVGNSIPIDLQIEKLDFTTGTSDV